MCQVWIIEKYAQPPIQKNYKAMVWIEIPVTPQTILFGYVLLNLYLEASFL